VIGVAVCTFVTVAVGLLYLNGGYDGSHLYPALWIFSLVGIVGLYGSWLLTGLTIAAGIAVVVVGKLAIPDLLFGIGADQSWVRVGAMGVWWSAGLLAAGVCGHRVLHIAQAGMQTREALHRAQAREHAAATETECLRLSLATERARALTELAHAFDDRVRTVVMTVAHTAEQIRGRATELSAAAVATGERAGDAAALSTAASVDTTVVAQAAMQLQGSLEHVREQARDAAEAASRVSSQVSRSDAALIALDSAAGQVGQAVALIGGIAARTNLLALNATIEAARAGGAGRGFAIVAGEVKLLAKQTADTTAEVERLVGGIHGASEGVAAALSSITRSIAQVAGSASRVDCAVEEQAAAIDSIARTAAALHEKAGRVSAQVSGVAGSAETTSTAAHEMLQAAALLGRDAGSLQREAAAFVARVHAV